MIAEPFIGYVSVLIEAIGILLVPKNILKAYTFIVLLTIVLFFMV
ncbi:MAG TPA: hypothetical protein VJI32_03340 [Candidatus Nanoarchaeia archaeon]|nr:hypothetical protein [Candidatus Nanoarchaeia archaeon]